MTSQTVSTPSAGFARRTPEESSVQLETSLTSGLTTQEANSRRLRYGANEFEVEDDEPIYMKFFKSFYENPLILLLLASAVVSLLMEQREAIRACLDRGRQLVLIFDSLEELHVLETARAGQCGILFIHVACALRDPVAADLIAGDGHFAEACAAGSERDEDRAAFPHVGGD